MQASETGMSRTTRYKLQYLVALAVALALAGIAVWALRGRPLALLGLAVLLVIPGRVSGFLWRDLYRGRRLCDAGRFEASLTASRRFISLLTERPRLRRLWWLTWAIYTRDSKAMAYNNVGAAQLNLGRLTEAESAFREALIADPEYPMPHFNLGVLFTIRGESLAAQQHANAAMTLGYHRDASDRIANAAAALTARIEGRGPGLPASHADA